MTSPKVARGTGAESSPPTDDDVVMLSVPVNFDAFYAQEYAALVAVAHALTGSRTAAEDVAQEAMLAAYRRWDEVSALESPGGWTRRVCVNIATSAVRRRLVEARAKLRLRAQVSDVTQMAPEVEAFWSEVRSLPRREAQCVALRYVYGCSNAEVAEYLGCAEGTVQSHLARAKTALGRRLRETEEGGRP